MLIDPNGWCDAARPCLSPNHDARPAGAGPDLVILHHISLPPDSYGGPAIERLFTNTLEADAHPYYRDVAHLRVSSHFLIRRDGELVQFVPTCRRAWHAGQSHWQGRERCNDFSIGVELEGCDSLPFEGAQYQTLAELLVELCGRFPVAGVTGHSDIAPGRKTDPGRYFSWGRLRRILLEAGQGDVALRIEPEGEPERGESDRMRWPFPLAERPL